MASAAADNAGWNCHFQASAEDELQSEGQKIVGQIVTMSVEIIRREWLRVQRGV